MAETTKIIELDEDTAPSSYTSETETAPTGAGQSITAPGAGLGRRKEAVARVRLVPGTGQWKLNGRTLEDYFPNKLHQQLVKSPFVLLDLDGRFDVIARIDGGGISGQAGALRLGIAAAAIQRNVKGCGVVPVLSESPGTIRSAGSARPGQQSQASGLE